MFPVITEVYCVAKRQRARACVSRWSPSCFLITTTVIIITIIIIAIILIVTQAHSATTHSSSFVFFPPAVFGSGGRINIHLGPYTGPVPDGVSGRAVRRLRTQWPTAETRERKHSHTHRGHQKIIPLTHTHTHEAHAARRWAGRESGGGVGRKNERITDGC